MANVIICKYIALLLDLICLYVSCTNEINVIPRDKIGFCKDVNC